MRFLHCQTPTSPVVKFLKEFDVQQRKKLENILGTVLPEDSWTQATLPLTLSGFGVCQCQDLYKASYVCSVLSSEDLVSEITGESPKNCQVFQDLYSSIAPLDISNFSQKTIQHALGKENFHGLIENLACERESAGLLSMSVGHAGAWLSAPPFQLLGFIRHQMSLELVKSTGWVSLTTTPKGNARSVMQEFLISMGIMPWGSAAMLLARAP